MADELPRSRAARAARLTDPAVARRQEISTQMQETMRVLDGSIKSRLAFLTGLSPEVIDRVGGVRE